MKTTFLIGLPRCGSLALSIMMNNTYCYAHHEGLDFDRKRERSFDETASSILMNRAHKAGKNYFCCDISCSIDLIAKYCDHNLEFGISPTFGLQVVHVITAPSQSTESLSILTQSDKVGEKVIQASIAALLAKIAEAKYYLSQKLQVPTLTVTKVGNRFTMPQIADIANFVGAFNDHDPIEMRKLQYLSDVHCSVNKRHIDKGIKVLGW